MAEFVPIPSRERIVRAVKRPVMEASVAVWIVAMLSGCAPRPWDMSDFLQSHEYRASGTDHKVLPGDTISFHSPYITELDGIREDVGTDGKIELDLIGQIHVAGLTAREIKDKLEQQLEPYYSERHLRVRVSGEPNQKIYVFGQVGGRGPRPYTGRDTVFDVLMASQPTFLAWKSKIRVIRASPNPDERREIQVNFDHMVQRGDLRRNVLLQPGDIVYVPPTPLAWVGLRIQELLFPLGPVFQAYSLPASVKSTNNIYSEDDDDDSGSSRRFARQSVLGRR